MTERRFGNDGYGPASILTHIMQNCPLITNITIITSTIGNDNELINAAPPPPPAAANSHLTSLDITAPDIDIDTLSRYMSMNLDKLHTRLNRTTIDL